MRFRAHSRLVALALIAAACSEPALAPERSVRPKGAPSLDVIMHSVSVDSMSADFTVTPSGGLFVLGPHAVVFPANAICDPATSSYGPTEWDQPCTPATEPIQIHAEVRSEAGVEYVDFTPSLRFVPTTDESQYVWIMMKSNEARGTSEYWRFPILFRPNAEDPLVDEALEDPTLRTYLYVPSGIAFRRIKHFTGYTIDLRSDTYISDVSPVDY
jgi:hypothetical protein